jgi:DNA-directed RNA polymerase subunit RPC12/RpoP
MTLNALERVAVVERFLDRQTDEEWKRLQQTLADDGKPSTLTIVVDRGCVTDVLGLPDGWQYEIDDHDILDEREDSVDRVESPATFRNHYKCYCCGHEWTDDYDAQPDDDCPKCGARHVSPHKSEDIAGDNS